MASAATARVDTVKIGPPLALSRSTAMIGQTAQHGLLMAGDEINAEGRPAGKARRHDRIISKL
jgi:ABC-type branched-subunit amino acid transport system substrate-binding protein